MSGEETGGFETSPEKRILLNYRRQDAPAHTARLYAGLAEHFGRENVYWEANIAHGAEFREPIEEALRPVDALLVVIGRDWLGAMGDEGDPVRLEVAYALRHKMWVIPVLVAGARMPAVEELPPDLAGLALRNPLELPDEDWPSGVEALLKSLEKSQKG